MSRTIFVAGATGAIGGRLLPLLKGDGWRVVGMTRTKEKATLLAGLGAEPVVVNAYDPEGLLQAVRTARPGIVMHQLTDLPAGLDPSRMEEATRRNARLRSEGTRNLLEAALAAGANRFIAQSVAFAYAEGQRPHEEGDPLATEAPGRAGISARGVADLERQVLGAPLAGLVLRYGRLYGPGTSSDARSGLAPLHVDAAAWAAFLAASRGEPGIYNVAEEDGTVDSGKARHLLGWLDDWRHER
jgi:nucleoside-diphosphate-sugar epimerase